MKRLVYLVLFGALAPSLAAQHVHPAGAADTASHAAHRMTGALGIPQAREGSGTSWLPDVTPMHAVHARAGGWGLMLHGNLFLQYIDEGSDRGDSQLGSINWLMGMAERPLAGGELSLRAMLSAEPWTVGRCGYPDLLATGELCNGDPIHDRQHPHDVLMELAAGYQRALGEQLAFEIYGGPVAEPALGPTAYPHRVSAFPGPLAPIAHHWLDATHITFGSVTAGLFGRRWKAEASVFNGREPDEERFDLDLAPLDSYSGRLTLLPSERWALQLSAGQLHEAEPGHDAGSRVDVTRYTASAIHHRPVAAGGLWATTLALGRNVEAGTGTNALLLETSLNLAERHILSARGEWVEKAGHDLALEDHSLEHGVFRVAKVGAGYTLQLRALRGWVPGIGGGVSMSILPAELEPFYGQTTPLGFVAFASLRPAPMRMESPTVASPRPMQAQGGMQHEGEPLDLAAVRAELATEGVRLGQPTTARQGFWKVPTTTFPLPAAHTPHAALQVNLYASPSAAHQDATERKTATPAWVAPPHFFHVRNALLVLLADPARDAELIRSVEATVQRLGGMRMPHGPGSGGGGHHHH